MTRGKSQNQRLTHRMENPSELRGMAAWFHLKMVQINLRFTQNTGVHLLNVLRFPHISLCCLVSLSLSD